MALIKCKNCGNTVPERSASCPHCGAPVKTDNVLEEESNALDMSNNGSDITNEKPIYEQADNKNRGTEEPVKQSGKSHGKSKAIFAAIGLALVLLIGGIAIYLSSKDKNFSHEPPEVVVNAAEQGNTKAQIELGVRYFFAKGVPFSLEESFNWYMKAAEQGNSGAQCFVELCYHYGDGVSQSDKEAIKWLRKAAKQRDEDAEGSIKMFYSSELE
ncbi:MAG: hypothetical protein LUC91_01430 [Prevotella sp.]|nr:hypothetical protein [Prevotella sp.]